MNVYRMEVFVIDHDNIGPEGVKNAIENARYPNHCIAPDVARVEARDIGEWRDDHPLNRRDTAAAEIARLFGS